MDYSLLGLVLSLLFQPSLRYLLIYSSSRPNFAIFVIAPSNPPYAFKLELLVITRLALYFAVVVPFILVLCSTVIEREGLVEGIYRLSGFPSMVTQLRRTFDKEDEASLRQRFQITSQGVRDSVFVEEAPPPPATPAPPAAGAEPFASASTSATATAPATAAPERTPSEAERSGPPPPVPGKTHTPDVLKRKQSFVRKWYRDIYSLAAVLKMYFRELPNPLFTYQLYNRFQVRCYAVLLFYARSPDYIVVHMSTRDVSNHTVQYIYLLYKYSVPPL